MHQHGTKSAKPRSSIVSKKLKFQKKDQTIAIVDEDDQFEEIYENLKELREKEPTVTTTSSTLTDEAILQEAKQTEND